MTTNIVNKAPFLFTSRKFPPDEVAELAFQLNIAYVDIANKVNDRTISLFPTSNPALNGEKWFINSNRQQSGFRKVFSFTTTNAITHNIPIGDVERYSNLHGTYTDGTNWYGLNPSSNVAIAGQITFYITATQILFLTGAGAPTLTLGTVVLEWLSQP